jgi:hypothetical protein
MDESESGENSAYVTVVKSIIDTGLPCMSCEICIHLTLLFSPISAWMSKH